MEEVHIAWAVEGEKKGVMAMMMVIVEEIYKSPLHHHPHPPEALSAAALAHL
jgi:hypothetical protein